MMVILKPEPKKESQLQFRDKLSALMAEKKICNY